MGRWCWEGTQPHVLKGVIMCCSAVRPVLDVVAFRPVAAHSCCPLLAGGRPTPGSRQPTSRPTPCTTAAKQLGRRARGCGVASSGPRCRPEADCPVSRGVFRPQLNRIAFASVTLQPGLQVQGQTAVVSWRSQTSHLLLMFSVILSRTLLCVFLEDGVQTPVG